MQVIKWDELEEISPVGLSSQNGLITKKHQIWSWQGLKEVQDVIALYLRRNDKNEFKKYVGTHGENINLESMEFITEILSSKELEDYISNIKKKERSDNKMCKASTELIQDGKDEGKIEGRLEGIPEGEAVKNMIKELGVSLSKALSVVKLSPDDWNKYNNTI
ncbi:MAG: hypothetical protein IJL55_07230 [Lachnospiraceae bacterium]|nr:hypothetical protein [Lachnospiraceae bacterium]